MKKFTSRNNIVKYQTVSCPCVAVANVLKCATEFAVRNRCCN